jgi:hypothetical protein
MEGLNMWIKCFHTMGDPGVLAVLGRMSGDIFVGVPAGMDADEGSVVVV